MGYCIEILYIVKDIVVYSVVNIIILFCFVDFFVRNEVNFYKDVSKVCYRYNRRLEVVVGRGEE